MFGSALVYGGMGLAVIGLVAALIPRRRKSGAAIVAGGVLVVAVGMLLPAPEKRVRRARTRLDEFVPVWQFSEHHDVRVNAPPDRVFAAVRAVRADEILLFRTLTAIRRGGAPAPESILNPGNDPLLDVATRNGFIYLADDPPRELVLGTVVVAPPDARGTLTPDVFRKPLRPGFALAAMNFEVRPDGRGGSLVSTETRVYANSDDARRRFAKYWRVIYPGSALIRRMWLRAIARRVMAV